MSRRKKHKSRFTILLIRSSNEPVLQFSLPRWLPWLLLTLAVLSAIWTGSFYVKYRGLKQQLLAMEQEQLIRDQRERTLRLIILSQHSEVKRLSREVQEVKAQAEEVNDLMTQVMELAGIPLPTPSAGERAQALFTGKGPLGNIPEDISQDQARDIVLKIAGESYEEAGELNEALKEQKTQLEDLEEALIRRLIRIPPQKRQTPEELQQQLKLLAAAPTRWPVDQRLITSGFGYRTFRGRKEFHTGIDIGVWYKTPVRATKDGKVVFAGWHPQLGWMVEIEHEMGYTTIYAHNSYYLVNAGDYVKEGQVIALSGDSGRTDGPHLHYEIRLNGKPVDPMIFLSLGESEGKQ